MTEDEKHRLNELMIDMDEYDTNKNRLAINENEDENETVVVEYNPFAVSLTQGQSLLNIKNTMRITNDFINYF